MSSRRPLVIAAVAAGVVAADQLSKTWALHHTAGAPRHVIWTLRFAVQFNTGIAFSQATGSPAVVTTIAAAILGVMVLVAWRTRGTYTALVMGLVIGGAVGNLVDRIVRHHGGAVIDWIDLRWWPVFNVADAAISIGVVLALARSAVGPRQPVPDAA